MSAPSSARLDSRADEVALDHEARTIVAEMPRQIITIANANRQRRASKC
jgi:hypothetical protein